MIKYKSLFLLVHLYTVSLAINSPTGQGLLNQLGAAFGQSGTPTLPNDAKATALTAKIFPDYYFVGITTPQLIFRIIPSVPIPLFPYLLTYTILYGMNVLVQDCVVKRGDVPIPPDGITFAPTSVGIFIKPHLPGAVPDLTESIVAAILRGVWEMTASYGAYTFDADIYLGGRSPANYRGHLTVYIKVGAENGTDSTVAFDLPASKDTASLMKI